VLLRCKTCLAAYPHVKPDTPQQVLQIFSHASKKRHVGIASNHPLAIPTEAQIRYLFLIPKRESD
jgi:H2-forming N5,N10-methylenetetrahydromethanopterin dehydrogenase-like enzyme